MTSPTWLCIDQGGHSTRAAVVGGAGQIVAEHAVELETDTGPGGRVEHDPAALLDSLDRCIAAIAAQLGGSVRDVQAAGLATQRSTLLCASRATAAALSPLISWQDRRGKDDLGKFSAYAQRVQQLTGLRLSPHYGVGKMRWSLQKLEGVRNARDRGDLIFAPLASYLLRHLSSDDRWRVDPVNASRTLLMDMRTACWSDELLDLFELQRATLPLIEPCRSAYGCLSLGEREIPITVVTGDQAAALYGSGEPQSGAAFVNIGTGAFIQTPSGRSPVVDERLLASIVWQDAATTHYVLEGTVNGAASAIDFGAADSQRRIAPDSPELLEALAALDAAPLFLNGVGGLGSPDWVANFPSRFEGDGTAVERLAAVYESIVYLILRNLQRMSRRQALRCIIVTGGLAQSDWLAQALADLAGLAVRRPANPEATLLGLAYLVSEGRCQLRANGDCFDPRKNALLERRAARWTRAMEAVIGVAAQR